MLQHPKPPPVSAPAVTAACLKMARSQWPFVKAANDGSTRVVNKYQMTFSTQITSRDGFVATALIDYYSED